MNKQLSHNVTRAKGEPYEDVRGIMRTNVLALSRNHRRYTRDEVSGRSSSMYKRACLAGKKYGRGNSMCNDMRGRVRMA